MPFMFVYSPEILLQQGNLWQIVGVITAAAGGMLALAAAVQGWWLRPLSPLSRALFLAAGVLCFFVGCV